MIASFHDFLARNEGRIERVLHWTIILMVIVLTMFSAATSFINIEANSTAFHEEAAKVAFGGLILFANVASVIAIIWIVRNNRRRTTATLAAGEGKP